MPLQSQRWQHLANSLDGPARNKYKALPGNLEERSCISRSDSHGTKPGQYHGCHVPQTHVQLALQYLTVVFEHGLEGSAHVTSAFVPKQRNLIFS